MGILLERLRQKHRTMSYPDGPAPELPERWRGEPVINPGAFDPAAGAEQCPTGALNMAGGATRGAGRCPSCAARLEARPAGGGGL